MISFTEEKDANTSSSNVNVSVPPGAPHPRSFTLRPVMISLRTSWPLTECQLRWLSQVSTDQVVELLHIYSWMRRGWSETAPSSNVWMEQELVQLHVNKANHGGVSVTPRDVEQCCIGQELGWMKLFGGAGPRGSCFSHVQVRFLLNPTGAVRSPPTMSHDLSEVSAC